MNHIPGLGLNFELILSHSSSTDAFVLSILHLRGNCVCVLDWNVFQRVVRDFCLPCVIAKIPRIKITSDSYQESKLHLIAAQSLKGRKKDFA